MSSLSTHSGGGTGAMRALLKTISSRVGWIGMNAMTGMITAHALGASGRGALAAMIMWPVFLAGTLTFGLPSALVYKLRQERSASAAELLTAALVLALGIGLGATLSGWFILPFWLSRYTPSVVRWAQWLMLFTAFSMVVLILRAALESVGRFGTSASSWVLNSGITLAALLVLWRFHVLTEFNAALCYVLAGVPVVAWMFVRVRRQIGFSFHNLRASSASLLGYGLRSYGIDLCGTLSQSVDQALVVGLITASEMGRYVVALSLSRTLNAVYQAAAVVLFPRCVGLSRRRSFETALRISAVTTAFVLPCAAILFLSGRPILHLLYGPEYAIANTLLRVLVCEAILSGITTLLSQPFMALGSPGTVTVLQVLGLALVIPLLLVLVPRMGTEGAGLALLASAALRLLLLFGSYVRLVGRLPRPSDLRSLFAGSPAEAINAGSARPETSVTEAC